MASLAVIGLGYVGLVHAVGFALIGHKVIGYDINSNILEKLRKGVPHIYEPGLEEGLRKTINDGRLTFSDSLEVTVAESEAAFITVGTPSAPDGSADLSQVEAAARAIGKAIKGKDWYLVVVKSTVPPGTTEGLVANVIAKERGGELGKEFSVASNPEFLREGTALEDFLRPDRIIIGASDERATSFLLEVYKPIEAPKIIMKPREAELVKYVSNVFLALKISFANEVGLLAKKLGIDTYKVFEAVGLDRRIGPHYFGAGLGFGGSCLPKDLRAYIKFGERLGEDLRIAKAAYEVNEHMLHHTISLLEKHLGDLRGKKIGILGLAFKPNTDDVRESRGLELAKALLKKGAAVYVHDPKAIEKAKPLLQDVIYIEDPQKLIEITDAVVIATAWPQYEKLNYKNAIVIDGRRVEKAREAKIYEGVAWA